MVIASSLGFPRIGPRRELKKALEDYWSGKTSEGELIETGRAIRRANWELQKRLGIDHIPSNDFSFYDHVLDAAAMVGAVPRRYGWDGDELDLDTYFAMARGVRREGSAGDVIAMEMTKWFDTNYHYIVPEFERGQAFKLASTKPIDEFLEARALGVHTRPALLGPVTFLLLGKIREGQFDKLELLDGLLPVYEEVLRRLEAAGADWVQVDEPALVLDRAPGDGAAYRRAYERFSKAAPGLRLLVATYFAGLRESMRTALHLPVAGLHLDLVRAPEQLEAALAEAPESLSLSLGVVDGRNVWRADLDRALELLERAVRRLGPDRAMVAPSCSLIHAPIDLDLESRLDEELRSWLAFTKQKVQEVSLLATALREGADAVREGLARSREAARARRVSPRIHNEGVQRRLASVTDEMLRRKSPFRVRSRRQADLLGLPPFPTTTIGSFPQTKEVRRVRAEYRRGKRDWASYERFLRGEIESAIRFQEEVGLDVLVHGEFERNDMVEYFGGQLSGFAFTQHGWVQSYGSRCVKPPIIYGDVSRTEPMTVEWTRFAQGLTKKPVKGMLTGPVTILQWSFVRDDQPREVTCKQIALAIRDEVMDLEAAGIKIIQIDEPALREGLPLEGDRWGDHIRWSVEAFRLASSGVGDETQIHTHMCYSEFNDIVESIAEMDADVISIESSRSKMELLDAFREFQYPNAIGPGVYDIHSPRVPGEGEIKALLEKAIEVLPPGRVWVNPDCGLKTRGWKEVRESLAAMVNAARAIRPSHGASAE